ncbi:hypothetical protein P691DRAFT_781768 [Macrolepiota fuliginosa MF-IS2]|uniref:Vitamin K epoxide reductase domain-containing protein n=1 Tax=Macrolepiota fuliginosa MF-IS2 TaxID=1400762 RepID=A0A9P6C450_9AGAR|nr:hypothetical protein P691DRAFT_781768 [Macrolepiota fuliginosa MF-IS2]
MSDVSAHLSLVLLLGTAVVALASTLQEHYPKAVQIEGRNCGLNSRCNLRPLLRATTRRQPDLLELVSLVAYSCTTAFFTPQNRTGAVKGGAGQKYRSTLWQSPTRVVIINGALGAYGPTSSAQGCSPRTGDAVAERYFAFAANLGPTAWTFVIAVPAFLHCWGASLAPALRSPEEGGRGLEWRRGVGAARATSAARPGRGRAESDWNDKLRKGLEWHE